MKTKSPVLIIVTLVLFFSLACNALMGTPHTLPSKVEASPMVSQTEPPTKVVPTETHATIGPYFTEEFDTDPQWDLAVIPDSPDSGEKSDPESVTTALSNSHMIFNIPEACLPAFFIYTGETYS